jgi:hypothetical protein
MNALLENAALLDSGLPKMAAAVLHANSPQGMLMRNGRLPPKIEVVDGVPVSTAKRALLASTAVYDGLAVLYNEAVVGSMLIIALPTRPTMGNLHKVLKGRGIVLDEDYRAYRAKFDVDGNRYPVKDRPLVVERLTPTLMKVSTKYQNFGREVAAAARDLGKESPELTHAKRLTGKQSKADKEGLRRADIASVDSSPLDSIITRSRLVAPYSAGGPEGDTDMKALDEAEDHELVMRILPPPRIGG